MEEMGWPHGITEQMFFPPISIPWHTPFTCRVDYSRVEEVGPERAAAEWVLRNGGKVKLSIYNNWTTDYNRLPSEADVVLEAIDAQGGSLIDVGLDHLGELHLFACMPVCSKYQTAELGLHDQLL